MREIDSKLDELSNSYREMSSINEKQDKRVRHLETKLIWIVTSYIVSQGIVFLSISRPSSISCNNWWYPFCLAFSVGSIFGMTFTSNISKWARTQYQYELNLLDLEMINYEMYLLKHGQPKVNALSNLEQQQRVLTPDKVKVYQRYGFMYLTTFSLIVFTFVILRSSSTLPCN